MRRRQFLSVAAATFMLANGAAAAEEVFKIGFIVPMTGPFASTGRQMEAAVKLYLAQNGDRIAGKKIEVLFRDDTSAADVTKRLAQELVVNEHVNVLAGFCLTPLALAAAPVAMQAKIPLIVTGAATSSITEAAPVIVRTSFTLPQVTVPLADWAVKNGIKKVVSLVSDYGPGLDAEKAFKDRFVAAGGAVAEELRAPLKSPDFAAFLQRAKDAKPDALFMFVPSGQGASLMKQVSEREFAKAGIKVIGTGDVTEDDVIDGMGDSVLGMITSHHYSAAHPSVENDSFVTAFRKANNGMRPNYFGLGGYDGMNLIAAALKKTNGDPDGLKLVEAMKGASWISPRGPVSIDPDTRDIIQNVYLRKVERRSDGLYNVEFETVAKVKDPVKAAKAK